MVPSANVACPDCGGRLSWVGGEAFGCLRCAGLLEQSPSAGWRAVGTVMGACGGGHE